MTQDETDQKPDVDQKDVKAGEFITLKVLGNDSDAVAFKIRKTTVLEKMMDAYSRKMGQDKRSLRFLYDGNRLQANKTAEEYEMEDGDQIQVTVEQSGGNI